MRDYFRGDRPWRELRNILERLPSMGGSHFVAARRADPDVYEEVLDLPDGAQQWEPRDVEWTQTHELLADLRDVADALLSVAASHPLPQGATPRKPGPRYPRPTRGIDVARARRRDRNIAELEDEVLQAQARWAAEHPED